MPNPSQLAREIDETRDPAAVAAAASHPTVEVRLAAARNHFCPEPVLSQLAEDDDVEVAATARTRRHLLLSPSREGLAARLAEASHALTAGVQLLDEDEFDHGPVTDRLADLVREVQEISRLAS